MVYECLKRSVLGLHKEMYELFVGEFITFAKTLNIVGYFTENISYFIICFSMWHFYVLMPS